MTLYARTLEILEYINYKKTYPDISCLLFFLETSTRTKIGFTKALIDLEIPYIDYNKNLSAQEVKKESIFDTISVLSKFKTDFVISRTPFAVTGETFSAPFINAGDGIKGHPTQALIDLYTIAKEFKVDYQGIKNLHIGICGDISRSRVARSNIELLQGFGAKVTLISNPCFMNSSFADHYKACISHSLKSSIKDLDALIMLRFQNERGTTISPLNTHLTLTEEALAMNPNIKVLHPGPTNYNVEVASSIRDFNGYLAKKQVEYSNPVRKAFIHHLLSNKI